MPLQVSQSVVERLRRRGIERRKARLRAESRAEASESAAKARAQRLRILSAQHHNPADQLDLGSLCTRVLALAQALGEVKFYPYQVELGHRIIESLLLHDGEVVTGLMARQAGKTSVLSSVVAAASLILPELAKQYPNDWRLNTTDDNGVYRGFAHGVKTGIYAPKLDQSNIMFDRVKHTLSTDTAKQVMRELKLTAETSNGIKMRFSNHSRILCESASEQSKIEGETHNLLIAEEAQDISDKKVRKSLHPMVAATSGTIVKIGTAIPRKCDFYESIKNNERFELVNGVKNHFEFPYQVVIRYNSFYRDYIEKEKLRVGEQSDEFRASYGCEWLFERGMFTTQQQLFNQQVALTAGVFGRRYPDGLPSQFHRQYSLVAGIDWGASYDSTVVTLIAVNWNAPTETGTHYDSDGEHYYTAYRKHIVDWLEFSGDNYEYQFHEIINYLSRFRGLVKVVTDSNTCGRPLFHRLISVLGPRNIEVEPFNFQARLKSDGYRLLYGDLCAGRLSFPAADGFRDDHYRKFVYQMLDLRKDYTNGLMRVAHPDEKGAHDDFCDSVMMAAWGANQPFQAFGGIDVDNENPFLFG